jgi:hypothetical protein
MHMTQRGLNIYGYVSVTVMLVLLLLVVFKQVPVSWYRGLFLIALVLFLIRITLRLVVARQARIERDRADKMGAPQKKENED